MFGGVAADGMGNGGTYACCNHEMRVGQKSRLADWELLLLSERAVLTSDAPSWVAICHTGDAAWARVRGWNRDLLLNAIKLNMYEPQALARVDNNFGHTLPAEQAQYANEVFGSSYALGFLGIISPFWCTIQNPNCLNIGSLDFCRVFAELLRDYLYKPRQKCHNIKFNILFLHIEEKTTL